MKKLIAVILALIVFAPAIWANEETAENFPTANSQITDSVTQGNASAAGAATGSLYQATAQQLANAAHNATSAQQQVFPVTQTVVASHADIETNREISEDEADAGIPPM